MIKQKGELLNIDVSELISWVFINQDSTVIAIDIDSAEGLANEILRFLENKPTSES